jgi:hypothetical protein
MAIILPSKPVLQINFITLGFPINLLRSGRHISRDTLPMNMAIRNLTCRSIHRAQSNSDSGFYPILVPEKSI